MNEVLGRVAGHFASPSLYQLAPLDQLHIGGIKASERLLKLLDPEHHRRVLDIGSGAGGLMRQATLSGFTLVGVDITHDLNRLNRGLSGLAQPGRTPPLVTADASALPFADDSFDAVLFQHSFLNMPDTVKVLGECRRVLHRGGVIVMHEVVSGPQHEQLRFPVPWASHGAHSCLQSAAALSSLLEDSGFHIVHWRDWSEEALVWRQRQRVKEAAANASEDSSRPAPALSPQLIFGSRFMEMGKNLLVNLETEAIRVVEIKASC
ncbi:class I SAM-dependent methyltransferase [Halomonas sp. Bachu 37]|uniref:class I SAM-dependent methyltransferase n=1 Tax=Halomonas kashgarensis TaxID=3084920 RepID=UPI003217C09F